ncbi:MAG: LysE family translocator [Gammaproteobacteria bacterium]|nr:LysE family translocator [Gammaproteobacteria bacterium]
MNIELWIAFVAASSILLIIPGPTILTVVSYSISHGNRVKLPLIAAVALGDSTALVLSLLGIGTLLAQSVFWFQAIKWAGGLYLLFLGVKLLRAGAKSSQTLPSNDNPDSGYKLFINTYLVTALNPKGIVFFIAFLPQFISRSDAVNQQLWILAATFVVLAVINAALYAIFAGQARRLLTSTRTQRWFNFTGGSLLSIAGIWALTARRVGELS